jgi:hypothetical protein
MLLAAPPGAGMQGDAEKYLPRAGFNIPRIFLTGFITWIT